MRRRQLFKKAKKTGWLVALVAIILGVIFFILFQSVFLRPADYAIENDSSRIEIEIKEPTLLYGIIVNDRQVIEGEVKRNQLFFDLFESVYIPPKIMQQLKTLPRSTFDFRKIGAYRKYTLIHENDSLNTALALIYEPNAIDYVIFHLKDTVIVENCQREITTVEKAVYGEIKTSLFDTIEELKISPELTNKVVDIFGWRVDFQKLQKGDQFKIIYEERSVDDAPISIGEVIAIYLKHDRSPYYAFAFDPGNGRINHYDTQGKSLRNALLKYPIEFTRISSRYNLKRFHPVAKIFRAHLGTDFAAPTGTPIRSVGEGRVKEAKYSAGKGNYVKIEHNKIYTTGYLHMSKIASGITAGARVRQGQVIGYVGSTGLSTGPHLCYRFWRQGKQVDALRVKLPTAAAVPARQKTNFENVKAILAKRLEEIHIQKSIEKEKI